MIQKSILLFFVAFTSIFANAQKDFEGVVQFKIDYINLPAEMAGMESMLPTDMTTYVKDGKVRSEQKTMITGEQIIIVDAETNYTVTLMNLLGNKIALEITPEEAEKSSQESANINIEYVDGTKEIAGYTCKKALIRSPDLPEPVVAYYTEEFKAQTQHDLGGIKGFPMEYVVSAEGIQMRFYVVSIDKQTVSDDLFIIPDGYKKMSQKELQQLYGG